MAPPVRTVQHIISYHIISIISSAPGFLLHDLARIFFLDLPITHGEEGKEGTKERGKLGILCPWYSSIPGM